MLPKVPAPFRPFLKRRSVEDFLFPSTYFFEPSSSATSLVARQIETFRQRWASVDLRAAKARKQSPYAVLIIASLIEKETVAPGERALVAAVIDNRLEQGMPLAMDASLRYGLGVEGTRPLKQSHLRSNTPYNTHRLKGDSRQLRSPTLACRRCAPLRSPRRSTTSTTSASPTACTTSSPPTKTSSARRPSCRLPRMLALRRGAELRKEVGHLQAGADRFGALVQRGRPPAPLLEREEAEGDRNAGLERRELQS